MLLFIMHIITTSAVLIILAFLIVKTRKLDKIYHNQCDVIEIKTQIINEYSTIRHEYNNILQSITNMIEVNDMEGLSEYKSVFMNQLHEIHNNNMTQLGKIKSISVLKAVHQIIIKAMVDKTNLHILVDKEIRREYKIENELCLILQECFITSSLMSDQQSPDINLKITESEFGLDFYFICKRNTEMIDSNGANHFLKGYKHRDQITYNSYKKSGNFIQELIIDRKER